MATDDLVVRAGADSDLDQILSLAARSLGWAADERDRAFFRWKHEENPAGRSPSWVAEDDGRIVAFRTFLRWELEAPDGRRLRMGRAVDTATDPDHQGRGLFRRLTLQAVEDLTADGFDAIFNTPNDQSRPGYLKMGWHQLGRPTIAARPATVRRALVVARSRQPAEKWSEPCTIGEPATAAVADLVATEVPPRGGLRTPRDREYLDWRYRFEPLAYRAVEAGGGAVVFRVRRRGGAKEVAVVEWLAARPDRRALARLVRAAGDYAVAVGVGARHGLVPLRGQGPIVTWRPLRSAAVPGIADLAFSLGDLELF